jgi:hypothetical protein
MMTKTVFVACSLVGVLVVTDVSAGGGEKRHLHPEVAAYAVSAEHRPRVVVEVRSSGPSLAGAFGETFVTST